LCGECLARVPAARLVCPHCTKSSLGGRLHTKCVRGDIDGMFAVWGNSGVVKKALSEIKYHYSREVVKSLVGLMARAIPPGMFEGDWLIVPIPLHVSRQRFRGFNQSSEIAKQLSKVLSFPVYEGVLVRERNAGQQVGRHRSERVRAMDGAFSVTGSVVGQKIILVDDVWTTGATMRSAALALKSSGAASIWCLVVAH
jgi:ComF family protein